MRCRGMLVDICSAPLPTRRAFSAPSDARRVGLDSLPGDLVRLYNYVYIASIILARRHLSDVLRRRARQQGPS
jgi:hypothetical protein